MTGRVVFLSWCFPPTRFPRSVQVARLLAHLDTRPIEVRCGPPEGELDPGLLALVPEDVDVRPLPWPRRAAVTRPARRLLGERGAMPDDVVDWARHAARLLQRDEPLGRQDVVVSIGQPMSDHLGALRLVRRCGARWIAHFSDPWSDSPFRRGIAPVAARNRRMERAVVERADLLVFTSDETVDLVMAKYPPALRAKVAVVPHAFDPDAYPPFTPRPAGPWTLRHLGAFYGPRRPDPVLRALALLARDEPDLAGRVRLELIGPMEASATTDDLLAALPAGLVEVRPPVPYERSLALMRTADALVVADAPADVSVFLPSKLVDYIGAGRPILAATPPGTSARVVRELGGPVVDPTDVEGIAAAIRDLAAATPVEPWGAPAVRARYGAPGVAAAFDQLLARVRGDGA